MSPLHRDLSALPKDAKNKQGCPPDPEPRFVHLLVEAMQAANDEAGPKPTAFGTRIRHSDAGKCARAIAFKALGYEGEPMDPAGVWVTSLGTMIHERWQESLRAIYPDAEVEPKLRIDGLDASGHADAVVVVDGKRVLVELKTTGGFSWKMKIGDRGVPEGPDYSHVLQAALNGVAVDADEIVIAYMATESISIPAARRSRAKLTPLTRFCAEWTFPREEFEQLAAAERARLQGILDLVDNGELPKRIIPSPELPRGHEFVDPMAGRWEVRSDVGIEDTGTYFACDYCAFQKVCATTASGRVPIPAESEAVAS